MNTKYRNRCYLLTLFMLEFIAPFHATAQGGYALDFDGTDDYVDCGNDASMDISGNQITLEAWIYPTAWASTVYTGSVIIKEGAFQGYMLRVGGSGSIDFHLGNNSSNTFGATTGTGVLSLNEWQHIAGVLDGTNMTLYVNGTVVATNNSFTGTIGSHSTNLYIGSSGPAARLFTGKIDETRIWSDARTEAEIQANMHKELVGNEANLVAYYPMSDGTGTSLTDNSTNSNTGTLTNSPIWKTSGAHAGSGMALDFDGTDDYVLMGSCPEYSTDLTYEGWIKLPSNPFVDQIIGFDGIGTDALVEFRIYQNKLQLLVRTTSSDLESISGTTDLTDNTWHHVAAVKEGTAVSLYVDGIEEETGTISLSPNLNYMAVGLLHLNGSPYGGINDYYFGGQIDEVRIWSEARTEAEIRANKDRNLEGDEPNLEAYYRFDQQANAGNTILYDYSDNGYNGTLTNMAPASDWVSSDPFNTWIGSEDSDWTNGDNWSSGAAPSSTQDVGVFAWAGSNAPASANISARNFYVASGVIMSHSGNLTVSDQYYNEGTFTTTGNVTFSGSAAQSIEGSGTSTFGTLTVNNSAGLTLEKDVTANTSLTLTSGMLDLNGNTLTLGNGGSISGTPSNTKHIIALASAGSVLQKNYSGTGSFQFPVGDGAFYTPITLNFTSGSFTSGNATVSLANSKHPNNSSPTDYLNRYWTVSSSGISGFSCSVSANYDDSDIRGTEADIDGVKWDGSSWADLGDITAGTNLLTGTVSSFSDFTGGEPGSFPVELLSLTGKPQNGIVLLDWTTASEVNSDYFSIERSENQIGWEPLGEVGAAGFSSQVETYQYKDIAPLNGKSYYRLKQIDLDGSFDFSPVVEVSFDEGMISIYPNPVKDILTIDIQESKKMKAQLIDMQGRIVLRSNLEMGMNAISMGDLSPGIYTLQLKDGRGKRQEFSVVKE